MLQHRAVVGGLNTDPRCSCCDRTLLQGSHSCGGPHLYFLLGIPWKGSLHPELETSPPGFGACLHKSQGIQALSWRHSHSQMEVGWMGMCCNERDWQLAFRNADCLDFHSAKKNRMTLMFYASQLILLKYSKQAYFKTMPNLNTGAITKAVHRFHICALHLFMLDTCMTLLWKQTQSLLYLSVK